MLLDLATCDQEEVRVICLDTHCQIKAIVTVYRGTLKGALMRIGEIFKTAIRYNSASILVCHNHPSGVVSPSSDDLLITEQIYWAGDLLEIPLVDHLIIGPGNWISLRQQGLGFPTKVQPTASRRKAPRKTPQKAKVCATENGEEGMGYRVEGSVKRRNARM